LHELGRGAGKFGEKTDADADGGVNLAAADVEGQQESGAHVPGEFFHRRRMGRAATEAVYNYGKLVASDPRNNALPAHRLSEPGRRLGENLVAGSVAHGFIDDLEAIEIDV
jgi:hypothetical protein